MLAEAETARMQDAAREALTRDLLATAAGDRAAFRRLYAATSAKLYGICLRICVERHTAEDALQDAFTTIWRNAGRYDPAKASPVTWMAAVARNRAIDRLRSGGRPARAAPLEEADEVADPAPGAEESLARSAEYGRLSRCLEELEPRHAAVIRTAFFEGRTYESLAEAEDVPVGTMKSWIRRGLIRLRGCLDS